MSARVGWMGGETKAWIDGWVGGQMHGLMDGGTNAWIDGWAGGQMHGLMDGWRRREE